jgi:hypothetical protein
MNWIENVKTIKLKLQTAGFMNLVDSITNAQMTLGTPGEMYLEVMNVCMAIKKDDKIAFDLIKHEVEELLVYGKKIEYFN